MAGTLRQGQSEFFQLPACQHGSDLRCRPSPTARLELLDTNTGLPAGPLYLLGVIPLIQQRPLPPPLPSMQYPVSKPRNWQPALKDTKPTSEPNDWQAALKDIKAGRTP